MVTYSTTDKYDSYTLDSSKDSDSPINTDTSTAIDESTSEAPSISISKENIPSFRKILVTHDGKDESNKAVNYAVALSNFSGAEITILRIVESVDNLESTSVNIENTATTNDTVTARTPATDTGLTSSTGDTQIDIQGPLVDAMEDTIRKCRDAGCNNKISYKFRPGSAVDEIVDEINTGGYNIVIMTSSNINSWIKSLFSDTRKIISNVNIPVLIVQ